MLKYLIYFIVAVFISLSVYADNGDDKNYHQLPSDMKQVGSAKFSLLFWDIYESTLYTYSGTYSSLEADSPVYFKIRYLRDISRQELIARTLEQWQHLAMSNAKIEQYSELLTDLWPDIKAGDSLALLKTTSKSQFFFNDKAIGMIDNQQFGDDFLNIWLSTKTSQPALRRQLLGAQFDGS